MHVKTVLGHKSIESTQVYVHIERAMYQSGANDEFHIKVASTKGEIAELLGTGLVYHAEGRFSLFQKKEVVMGCTKKLWDYFAPILCGDVASTIPSFFNDIQNRCEKLRTH
jgi:hypothetical protein